MFDIHIFSLAISLPYSSIDSNSRKQLAACVHNEYAGNVAFKTLAYLCDGDGGGASIAAAATTYVQQRFAVSIHENYMRLFIYESHAYNRTHTCTSPQICFEINK